ncbi:hypothetical protein K6W16_15870 [Burkholderia dolosa]|uniref:Uncharacterized protein n=1 Tax=Burkholderia dolosa TaxID=152500 RepID=A0A892I0W5_9BURK|nr:MULTISPECIES: hypothetical protein [Burkholderia]MBR8420303.1 hypothetical protein [Burkholderia dolosa]MBY4658739.1 hypothetical protein [Burkholderia dolosa]MBY4689474.1 hypothetical protein [Burkholderia dolosa]MBY4780739.1 hypothetical protein [Burkholderia dolosa]MBY4787401.1 hypothetical protein [Burkholderia dolosa]
MNGWIGRRATARSIIAADGAPGKPFSGKLRVLERGDAQDNAHKPVMLPGHDTFVEGPWIWQWQWESRCSVCSPAVPCCFSISSAADGIFCRIRQARPANGGLFAFRALTNCKRLYALPQYSAKCLGALIRPRHNRGAFFRTRAASSAFLSVHLH